MSRLVEPPQVVTVSSVGNGVSLSSNDLWSVLSRRQDVIGIILLISVLGALGVSVFLLPKVYESTATLLPQLDSKEGGSLAALLTATGAGGMAQNLGVGLPGIPTTPTDVFVAILKSRTMADEAITKFNLMTVYGERTMHDTRVELAERVRITLSKEKVIRVTVEDRDPQMAADIAAYFVTNLDRLNRILNVSKASHNREFIERRLAETQVSLVKTEEALRDFQTKNKAVAIEAQSKAMIEAAAMIQGQITGYEVQLQVMSAYLSPEHPDLTRVRSSLEELKKQLSLMEVGKDGKGILSVGRLHPSMITVPDLALQYGRLFRELKVQETLYALLTSQYEQAKITEARDTPTVQVLDAPVRADKSIKPRVFFNTVVAGVMGLGFAIAFAYMLEGRTCRKQTLSS